MAWDDGTESGLTEGGGAEGGEVAPGAAGSLSQQTFAILVACLGIRCYIA